MLPRIAVRCVGDDGRRIVHVPLANEAGQALVDEEDYDRLISLGLTPSWYLNGCGPRQYVRAAVNATGKNVGVARIIVGAGPHQIVRYRSGDTTDLRRSNLVIARGTAKRTDTAVVTTAYEATDNPPPPRQDPFEAIREAGNAYVQGLIRDASGGLQDARGRPTGLVRGYEPPEIERALRGRL